MSYQLLLGDCVEVMRGLPSGCVQTCVTSPPYFGLRSYLDNGHTDKSLELGTEETPDAYVAKLVEVFREVKRVLRDDGTLWLNLGDSYANDDKWGGATGGKHAGGLHGNTGIGRGRKHTGLKPKDLIGIPWLVAFALRADGWYLRSDIIWHKPNPMPESVTDRPTKAHEYIFLLSKSREYFYDSEAIKEPNSPDYQIPKEVTRKTKRYDESDPSYATKIGLQNGNPMRWNGLGRNKRSVWTVTTKPYAEAHFATFPTALVEPCILAGSSAKGACAKCGSPWERVVEREYVQGRKSGPGNRAALGDVSPSSIFRTDMQPISTTLGWQPTCTCNADIVPCTVLDCFAGSGTTLAVAMKHHRNAIGIELNESYHALAHRRIERTQPMLFEVTP